MNDLQYEKSPYLRQHQSNPVQWFPWGAKAFEKALHENKPVFLSIGYSTCHWCHVMARESFESPDVADVLNNHFVAIKLDREERPDVDEIYMSALLALTGSGGWPLSAWLTPDGRPFFAGTYFPKPQFLTLLSRINEIWSKDQGRLLEDAEKFKTALITQLASEPQKVAPSESMLGIFDSEFEQRFDEVNGGYVGGPKFPQTFSLIALMRSEILTGSTRAREMVDRTLEGMITRGLFDHVEGGFHRYAVDEQWNVSHFEKMLYDQAWIVITLIEASKFLEDSHYLRVAEQTLDFVRLELTHPQGGFYTALDAESINPSTGIKQEGYYYTFLKSELEVLGSRSATLLADGPKLDGRIVLHQSDEPIDFSRLRPARAKNPKPARDEKIIAAWNGWMISAFCAGYQATGKAQWLETAQRAWHFIETNLWHENELSRRWAEGDRSIVATSEDYTSLIDAAINLYQCTLEQIYLDAALKLQNLLDQGFEDDRNGGYFMSDGSDPHLLLQFQQDSDGVTPSSNSMAAHNLSRLSLLNDNPQFATKAGQLFEILAAKFARRPLSLGFFIISLSSNLGMKKILCINPSKETSNLRDRLQSTYLPFALLQAKATEDETESFQICTNDRCLPPVNNMIDVLRQLKDRVEN
jgi:uncharacterized protein YyaL (SSP411 family)